jgi:antitoxin component of RelBE/YafQ-DinJ toxin-antitoxin module
MAAATTTTDREETPMTHTDSIRRTLENFARDGILPFEVTVQLREDGRWTNEARGTSVAWLIAAADDASDFGQVQLVSQFGNVING